MRHYGIGLNECSHKFVKTNSGVEQSMKLSQSSFRNFRIKVVLSGWFGRGDGRVNLAHGVPIEGIVYASWGPIFLETPRNPDNSRPQAVNRQFNN